MPDQNRVLRGPASARTSSPSSTSRCSPTRRATPTWCCRRRRFSRTTTSRRATGRSACSSCGRSIEPSGEARPNAEVFSELAGRLGLGEPEEETDTLLRVVGRLPDGLGDRPDGARASSTPPFGGAPVQFVDVFPLTPDSKIDLFPAALVEHTRDRLYVYQPDPETEQYPLALISPASEKTVSSTLGELRERAAMLQMHPTDAAARSLSTGRSGPRLQRSRRSPLPGGAERRYQAGHRVAAEGPLAPEHVQRLDRERARARLA